MAEYEVQIVSALLFVLIFSAVLTAVRRTALFEGRLSTVVAVVVALLCVIGMWTMFAPMTGQQQDEDKGDGLHFLLLPYAALALSILAILLIKLLMKPSDLLKRKRRLDREQPGPCNRHARDIRRDKSGSQIRPSTNWAGRLLRRPAQKGEQE